jgi:hypothetical protein
MPIPHYTLTGSITAEVHEAVHLNLFECSFILPQILTTRGYDPFLLTVQGTNISIDTTPDLDVAVQRFKYSTRAFLGAGPGQTHVEFSITFQINVNLSGEMETYTVLRSWYDLGWNSQTGTLHYKRDCIGTIICHMHDKKGVVLRRVTFNNCQVKKISGFELDWTANSDLATVTADFVSDYYIDEYIDSGLGFTFETGNELVPGY